MTLEVIDMYYIGHMGYFGWFGMILFWGLIIWLIVWLINKNKEFDHKDKTPLQIIKKRYAKGDITKKQFEEMKKEL
jgi:putative membrane protein